MWNGFLIFSLVSFVMATVKICSWVSQLLPKFYEILQMEISGSGTDHILLLILFFFFFFMLSLLGWPCSKSLNPVVSNSTGMKFGRTVLQVSTHELTESDFQFDVTLSRWRPWRHFMQKSAATSCVHSQHLPGIYAAVWCIVHSYVFTSWMPWPVALWCGMWISVLFCARPVWVRC